MSGLTGCWSSRPEGLADVAGFSRPLLSSYPLWTGKRIRFGSTLIFLACIFIGVSAKSQEYQVADSVVVDNLTIIGMLDKRVYASTDTVCARLVIENHGSPLEFTAYADCGTIKSVYVFTCPTVSISRKLCLVRTWRVRIPSGRTVFSERNLLATIPARDGCQLVLEGVAFESPWDDLPPQWGFVIPVAVVGVAIRPATWAGIKMMFAQ